MLLCVFQKRKSWHVSVGAITIMAHVQKKCTHDYGNGILFIYIFQYRNKCIVIVHMQKKVFVESFCELKIYIFCSAFYVHHCDYFYSVLLLLLLLLLRIERKKLLTGIMYYSILKNKSFMQSCKYIRILE